MTTNNQTGSTTNPTHRREVLVNFCRTVLRSDDHLLRIAMSQYQQALAGEQRH